MKNERYYYSIMSPEEKNAYKLIYNALKMRAYNIAVPNTITADRVQEIYIDVLFDTPLFFFVNQRVVKMNMQYDQWVLYPEYLYTASEAAAITADIRKKVNKVVDGARSFSNNIFRLEKYLHDSVVKSVAYDYEALSKDDCFNAHSIVGAFLENKAVCEGIAKAFKLLCNEFGLKCIVVVGKADPECNFNKDTYHAWNIVKIGEESYHVDVTWDNLYDKEIRHISYDYFNLTTEDILLDHRPLGKLPLCDSTTLNYFYCTNSFISSYEELVELIDNRYESKEIMFRIKNGSVEFQRSDEIKEKTMAAVLHVMSKNMKPKPFTMLFNEPYKIGKIIFQLENQKKIDLKKYPRSKK